MSTDARLRCVYTVRVGRVGPSPSKRPLVLRRTWDSLLTLEHSSREATSVGARGFPITTMPIFAPRPGTGI